MKHKWIRNIWVLFAFSLVILSVDKSVVEAADFKDVRSNAYYYQAVNHFVEQGYITGFSDNTFRPDSRLTREQSAIILSRVLNVNKGSRSSYIDVPKGSTYYNEIMAISDLGIITGYADGTFKPNSTLTRGQMALIISRTYELANIKLKTNPFSDIKGTIYENAVRKLYSAGITNGVTATSFAPNQPVTRGQFVTILHRGLQVVKKETKFVKLEVKQGTGNSIQVKGTLNEPVFNSVEVTINQIKPSKKWIGTKDVSVTNGAFIYTSSVPETGEYDVTVKIKGADVSVTKSVVAGKLDDLVKGVTAGKLYNTDVAIHFSYGKGRLARNQAGTRAYTTGTPITTDGDYVFYYEASLDDIKEIRFSVDKTNPVVTGVEDGRSYYNSVNIKFNEGKAVLQSGKSKGKPFHSGTTLQEAGEYQLIVTDGAGNETTIDFKIDLFDSELTGIIQNGVYNKAVRPTFKGGTATIRKNFGAETTFKSGTTLKDEGIYLLNYTNSTGGVSQYYFEIDNTAPVIAGIENKGVYNPSVIISYNEGTGMLQRDSGQTIYVASGTKVTVPGKYELTVADETGNLATVSFTIDTTLPIVSGVMNKGVYNKPVTISFDQGAATIKKDSGLETNFISGKSVSAPGVYTLTVTGTSGKKVVISFTIDSNPLVVGGVENNKVYNHNVTVYFTNRTAWLSLDGGANQQIYSGSTISAEGSYVLTLVDPANNHSTIFFKIDKTSPTKPDIDVVGRTLFGSELVLRDYTPVQIRLDFQTVGSGRVQSGDKLAYRLYDNTGDRINTEITLNDSDINNGYVDFFIPSDLLQSFFTRTKLTHDITISAYLTDQAGNSSNTTYRSIRLSIQN